MDSHITAIDSPNHDGRNSKPVSATLETATRSPTEIQEPGLAEATTADQAGKSESKAHKAKPRSNKRRAHTRKTRAIIRAARKEAKLNGRRYGGAYPSLTVSSVNLLVDDKEDAIRFSSKILDQSETTFMSRLVFFTDASLNPIGEIGGVGITSKRIPSNSPEWIDACVATRGIDDVNVLELLGVAEALRIAEDEARLDQQSLTLGQSLAVYVITDSTSALDRIESFLNQPPDETERNIPEFLHPIFEGLVQILDKLVQGNIQVHFRWTKGHAGVEGNTRADRLAFEGRKWMEQHSSQESVTKPWEISRLQKADVEAKKLLVDQHVQESLKEEAGGSRKRKRVEANKKDVADGELDAQTSKRIKTGNDDMATIVGNTEDLETSTTSDTQAVATAKEAIVSEVGIDLQPEDSSVLNGKGALNRFSEKCHSTYSKQHETTPPKANCCIAGSRLLVL